MAIAGARLSGKTLLLIGKMSFADRQVMAMFESRKATCIGPLPAGTALEALHAGLACDAVILEIDIADDLMIALNDVLERKRLPFVFAGTAQTSVDAGFTLDADPQHIDAIALALFGEDWRYAQ